MGNFTFFAGETFAKMAKIRESLSREIKVILLLCDEVQQGSSLKLELPPPCRFAHIMFDREE